MSSSRNISKVPGFALVMLAFVLAGVVALTTLAAVPAVAVAADAGSAGPAVIGMRITDSSKNQSTGADGQPGVMQVGMRVTDSGNSVPVTVEVTFDGNEGMWPDRDTIKTVNVALLQPSQAPKDLSRPGYRFVGWSLERNGTVISLPDSTIQPATWYAVWELLEYQISYDVGSGTNASANPGTYDVTQLPLTLADAKPATGYQFDGWMCDQVTITNSQIPAGTTGNLTLVASYSPRAYMLSFESNGGSKVASMEVPFESLAEKPVDPTRGGYAFDGWYKDEKLTLPWEFTKDTMPAEPVKLYAKWSEHIECDVPISALFQVDATGVVTDITSVAHAFASQTDAPLVVNSAESELLAGANTLFPDEAARKDVAILITPQGGAQKSIPLKTQAPVSLNFRIKANATLPVTFDLDLPATARLNYLANDGQTAIAQIIYTISLATA